VTYIHIYVHISYKGVWDEDHRTTEAVAEGGETGGIWGAAAGVLAVAGVEDGGCVWDGEELLVVWVAGQASGVGEWAGVFGFDDVRG